MSSIVLELQQAAMDKDHRVDDLLRKCVVIASKLQFADFLAWTKRELDGYSSKDKIPKYRTVPGEVMAFNPYKGVWMPTIWSSGVPESLRRRPIHQALAQLQELLDRGPDGILKMALPGLLGKIILRRFSNGRSQSLNRDTMKLRVQVGLCALTAALFFLGCKTLAPSPTYYPTDDGFLFYFDDDRKEFVMRPEKLKEALSRPECRPAARDPEGNWGTPLNGFQVSTRLPAKQLKVGDSIPVEMFVRNISNKQLHYEVLVPDIYHKVQVLRDGKRLLSKEESRRDSSFRGRLLSLVKDVSQRQLFPRSQHRYQFELLDIYDLSEPGIYAFRMGRVVPGSDRDSNRDCWSKWVEFQLVAK